MYSALSTNDSIRTELTDGELAAIQPVQFGLNLRHFRELESHISKGEVISIAELKARYLPLPEDWRQVAQWARAAGYTVESEDEIHLTVFAKASVARVQETLQVRFVRIIEPDGREYTSATDKPVLPAEIASLVNAVYQLHPQIIVPRAQSSSPALIKVDGGNQLLPQAIASLYNASIPGLDGAGETIVVLGGGAKVNPSDLTTFWTQCGLPITLDQFSVLDVKPPWLTPSPYVSEETKDIQWASAMAPKAKILHVTSIDPTIFTNALLTRLVTDPSIHQATMSFGLSEASSRQVGVTPAHSQYYAVLAAAGITVFVASGDHGAKANFVNGINPIGGTRYFDPNGELAPDYPASDPYVTSVGGTAVGFVGYVGDVFTFPVTEGGWCLPFTDDMANYNFAASTGGLSVFFQRPSWQRGVYLPAGTMRCVPDVAAIASSYPAAYAYYSYNGGAEHVFGGTSMSAPVWAGICALLNQARAKAGLSPLGLLGPHIYPLMGTSAFNPQTSGSQNAQIFPNFSTFTSTANNGTYGMGAGYNMVTGLGSPNVANLVQALTIPPTTRLANIAARGYCSTDARVMIGGFVIGGSSSKRVLVRATGPSLASRGLNAADVLADPMIEVHRGQSIIATNDNWGDNSNIAELNAVAAQIGAGALDANDTKSSALLLDLQPGAYTFVARGKNDASGIVLLEVFDADSSPSGSKLVNIATRAYSKPGDGVTIGGFVISGDSPKQVLLRAVGPTLTNFGLTPGDVLADPTIELHDASHGNTIIGTNDNWRDDPDAAAVPLVGARIGASSFDSADTKSSALLLTLDPGAYTFIAGGKSNTSGIVLVEIYDAD